MIADELKETGSTEEPKEEPPKVTFWDKHGANIGLTGLVIYVILLAIGTAAEVFEIDSILNWWIFRPPGRQ